MECDFARLLSTSELALYTCSVEIIRKQLTQASFIVVALISADAISLFANNLHVVTLATIVRVLPVITLALVWIECRPW